MFKHLSAAATVVAVISDFLLTNSITYVDPSCVVSSPPLLESIAVIEVADEAGRFSVIWHINQVDECNTTIEDAGPHEHSASQ